MSLLPIVTFLTYTFIIVYTTEHHNTKSLLNTAYVLWNETLESFESSSYVYGLHVLDCDSCTPCEKEPKDIIINSNLVQKVQYDDKQSECNDEEPVSADMDGYNTLNEWFEILKQPGYHATYDKTYGFPTNMFHSVDDSTSRTAIICVSFLKEGVIANGADATHCSTGEYTWMNDDVNASAEVMTTTNDMLCESQVIYKENCTQWSYVYTTAGSTVIISTLSILCFWMYYRHNDPATKGYKRSQSDDFVNDNSDSDCDAFGDDIVQKKRKSKLLGIDENKVIPRIKIKKNAQIKYGSIAQTDEDEKSDNSFDVDLGSDRSDEWHFVSDNKDDAEKKKEAASCSDQTDEEQED